MSLWRGAEAPDGRTYYYHTVTKETSWERPADFDTPKANGTAAEWKEAKAADGRTYYYNATTNATQWDKPAGFQAADDTSSGAAARPVSRAIERRDTYNEDNFSSRPVQEAGRGGGNVPWERKNEGFTGAAARGDEPVYSNPDEAEAAFFKLLRTHDVKWDSEWTDVVRQVGREKGFRAVADAGTRRDAFDKYCREEQAQEAERDQGRKKKRQDDFLRMLEMHDEIRFWTRWKTARPGLESEISFKAVGGEDERKRIFAEFRATLLKEHEQEEASKRQQALPVLRDVTNTLVTTTNMLWHDAYKVLRKEPSLQGNNLSKIDLVEAFEQRNVALAEQQRQKKIAHEREQPRRQRKARDAFRECLAEHVKAGNIKAGTTWQDFYPRIAKDERYLNLLGLVGSTPLDLFWDEVDEQEQQLRAKREACLDVLDAQRFEVTAETSVEEFAKVMSLDRRTASISFDNIKYIYKRILDKVKRRQRDQQAVAERGQQDAIDDFKSALRHLEPPLHPDDEFEAVSVRLDKIPASRVLSEDIKRTAFDRHMRRLREKAQDREADRRRKESRNDSRRSYDYDHEYDRDHPRRQRTRSPEIDAYEADRRKAQADRERQHRKASFGLSPPPRDRRDDRYSGRRSDKYDNVYDRERAEREMDRERSYINRADPRDRNKVTSLDYGDEDVVETPSTAAPKRRGSEASGSSKREAKRARRNGTEHGAVATADKDEPALQSGSEEGEIEETRFFILADSTSTRASEQT